MCYYNLILFVNGHSAIINNPHISVVYHWRCVYYLQHCPMAWRWRHREGFALSSLLWTQATDNVWFAMSRAPAFSAFHPPMEQITEAFPGGSSGAWPESSVYHFCLPPTGQNSVIHPHSAQETDKWSLGGSQRVKEIRFDEHRAVSVTSSIVLNWG